jgi:D-xylose transport system substrate-binding protein
MKRLCPNILVISLGVLLFLGSCTPQTPKIGVLIHSLKSERWVKDRDFLVENLEKLSAEVSVKIADDDPQKQISQAEILLKEGAQVLIVVAIDQNEASKIVEMAHEAGVKVIAYDRMIGGCKLDYYITTNSTRVGEMQASYLTSRKPTGRYALICGSKYDDNSKKLFLGQMNVLQPLMATGNVQVVYSDFTEDWTFDQGVLHARKIFKQETDSIAAIIAGNDQIADGVISVLKEKGLDGKVMVAGQDSELDNIKEMMAGAQTCDILKPLNEMASITAELAVSLAKGKPLKMKFTNESNGEYLVKSIMLDPVVVNQSNIESTVIASGFHTKNELSR